MTDGSRSGEQPNGAPGAEGDVPKENGVAPAWPDRRVKSSYAAGPRRQYLLQDRARRRAKPQASRWQATLSRSWSSTGPLPGHGLPP